MRYEAAVIINAYDTAVNMGYVKGTEAYDAFVHGYMWYVWSYNTLSMFREKGYMDDWLEGAHVFQRHKEEGIYNLENFDI